MSGILIVMKKVGILRGGISDQYDFSLETGAEVARAVQDAGFEAIDMLLDKDGLLHIKGIPADLEKVHSSVDTVWNALHGEFGEDGKVQELFENFGIPYTGAGRLASGIGFNKEIAKEHVAELGIKTPTHILIVPDGSESVSDITRRIYTKIAPPWVIKPLVGGASAHTYFAFTTLDLAQIVEDSVSHAVPFIAEQYIFGKEVAVGVMDDFRSTAPYALPPIEIQSPSRGVLTRDMRKQNEYIEERDTLTQSEKELLTDMAKKIHTHIGAKDYSQVEFILDKYGAPWFVEIDTHPHLHEKAPFREALNRVGAKLSDVVASIINKKE